MDNIFYSELPELPKEVLDELENYESIGKSGAVFDKIRAVRLPCFSTNPSRAQTP